jgi:hypothetical protein
MSADRVDILSDSTGELVASCYGPTAVGSCPHADSRGVVACAGCRIAPVAAGPEYWNMSVPRKSRHCPLAWQMEYVGM